MTEIVNVYEAKAQLSSLLDRALKGETIFLAKRNIPLVKLTPIERSVDFVGLLEGRCWIADDFDTMDLTEMFYGASDEDPI